MRLRLPIRLTRGSLHPNGRDAPQADYLLAADTPHNVTVSSLAGLVGASTGADLAAFGVPTLPLMVLGAAVRPPNRPIIDAHSLNPCVRAGTPESVRRQASLMLMVRCGSTASDNDMYRNLPPSMGDEPDHCLTWDLAAGVMTRLDSAMASHLRAAIVPRSPAAPRIATALQCRAVRTFATDDSRG